MSIQKLSATYNKLLEAGQYEMVMGMFLAITIMDTDADMESAVLELLELQAKQASRAYAGIQDALTEAGFTKELILEVIQNAKAQSDSGQTN